MIRALTICLVLAASCARSEPEVEFVATALTEAEWESWSRAGIKSAHHEITVRRTMRTPSWCRHLDATVLRTTSELVLRITSEETDDPCPAGEGLWGYMALIRNLDPGRYQLRVVHTYADDRRPSEVVLRHQVVVEE